MGLFSGPNKSLVQEALEIGISNLEKSRRVDTKKLYEEVKAALADESSPEMQNLYRRYISLYEAGLKTSTDASTTLKDEVKWKHLGDLREAVKNGGKGLSLADIEGLNQFALAEHGRQDRSDSQRDDTTVALLGEWFRMYETLKQKSIESMKVSYKDALRAAFLTATSTPFTFRYSEGNNIYELSVTLKDNKIVVGSKEHALVGERIKVGSISMDKDKLYIPFTMDGKASTYSEPIKKQEFLDKYLQDILDGKDIRIQGNLVRVSRTGELSPRVLVEGPAVPRTQAEIQRETLSLDEAIKKGFMSLVSGKKSEPLTVLQDGKKYRFPLEVDQNSFTLGGKKFDFTFPSDIRRGSFEFSNDAIIFSGISRGESRVKELFEISKSDVAKKLSGATNEVVFGSEETGKIVARGTGEYLPSSALINSPNPPANAPSATSPVGREGVKYGLKELEGYAKEKLALYAKDIGALQSALKAKKFYTGEITGVYDMATLDAVLAFQKTIKNAKYGADGLVGEETISALFGISTGPNNPAPVPPVSPAPGAPGAPPVAPLPAPVPGTRPGSGGVPGAPPAPPAAPRPSGDQPPLAATLSELGTAIYSFRQVIKANDQKVSGSEGWDKVKRLLPTSERTIKTSAQAIEEAYGSVQVLISKIDPNKLSDKDRAVFNAYILELARYYADEHSVYGGVGVENRHWKNYPRSLELAGSMLKTLFIKEKIVIDPPPTDDFIRTKMRSIDPVTADKFDALYGKGYSFRDIMSNPTLNGAWDEIRQKVLGDYEKKIQRTLSDANNRYKAGTLLIPDPDQKKAFDLMVDIMGAGGFWDAKAEDRDKRINIAIIAGSALAGTAAAIATAPVSIPGMVGAAVLGGGITTAGSMIAKGSIKDGDQAYYDTLVELGLNTVTFGAGGAIARVGVSAWGSASMITSKYGALAAKSGIILSEGTAGMALGASIEKTRAQYEGIGLSWTESMKNNFWWAFLPLAIQYKGVFKQQSIDLARRKNNNAERAQISGPTPAVQAEAKAIAADAEALGAKVQAEQAVQAQHAPAPATGSRTAPASAAPPAPAPKAAPPAKPAPKPTEAPVSYDVGNGYILQARPDNKFIVLKDGNPQGSIPKSLAEIEWELATAHNTIIPEGVKAQIAARSAVPPAPTVEPPAPAQAPKPAPEPAPEPPKSPPVAAPAPARAGADDHAVPAPAPKRKPASAHDEAHLTQTQAHAVSEEAAKTVNQQLAKFSDSKAVKLAWDIATKEIQPGGLIKSVLVFPANIMRLPAINARRVLELWFKKSEKGFQFTDGEALDKVGKSLVTAASLGSKPWEGATQKILTLATLGSVAWMTYDEIQRANPNAPWQLVWGAAYKFLINMNYAFPIEFYKWFTTKIQSEAAGAQVPSPAPRAVPAPTPPLASPPPEQRAGELPPSEVQPGEVRTDPISDTTTPQ